MVGSTRPVGRDRQSISKPCHSWIGVRAKGRRLVVQCHSLGCGVSKCYPAKPSRRTRPARTSAPLAQRRSAQANPVGPNARRCCQRDCGSTFYARSHPKDPMDGFAIQRADRERSKLIGYLGGCERILKAPLARPTVIQVRQLVFLFLWHCHSRCWPTSTQKPPRFLTSRIPAATNPIRSC